MDHETERQERLREEGRRKKADEADRVTFLPILISGVTLTGMASWQKQKELDQKKTWEEEKKQRNYEGMFDEEHYAERDAWSDDDFM